MKDDQMSLIYHIKQEGDEKILKELAKQYLLRLQNSNGKISGWVDEYSPNISFIIKEAKSKWASSYFYRGLFLDYGTKRQKLIKELNISKKTDPWIKHILEDKGGEENLIVEKGRKNIFDFLDLSLQYFYLYSSNQAAQLGEKRELVLLDKEFIKKLGYDIAFPELRCGMGYPEERNILKNGEIMELPKKLVIPISIKKDDLKKSITKKEKEMAEKIIAEDGCIWKRDIESVVLGNRKYEQTYNQLLELAKSL